MSARVHRRALASCLSGLILIAAETGHAANVAFLKPIINSTGSYPFNPGFGTVNSVDGQSVDSKVVGTLADDVFSNGNPNSSSYWLTADGAGNNPATSFFILDLGQAETISQFRIAPTRNTNFGDRGTTQFNVLGSNTIDGGNNLVAPTPLISGGTLVQPGSATGIPFAVFNPMGPSFGTYRYLQFEGTAAVSGNGGINELQVLNDFNPTINIGTFTGGDVGEGLNLDGYFLYARHAEAAGIHVVRDARFIPAGPSGQLVTHNTETSYGGPSYGGSANDAALAQAMNYVKYSDGGGAFQVSIDLPGLTVGKTYELQLMFNEAGSDRGFDIFMEGGIVVENFNPGVVAGLNGSDGTDAVVRATFVARDTTANIRLDGNGVLFPDRNPIIDAFTLQQVGYTPTVTVGQLTGGDLGEGLDLEGKFIYARHAGPSGTHTVRGVEFTPAGVSGGLVTHNQETVFGAPNYGASADDAALSQIMDYVKFDDDDKQMQFNLPGLIVGREYKLQLLFNEDCCDRQFDIFHDNHLLVSQFNPGVVAGAIDGENGIDAMITYEFIANDTNLRLLFSGVNTPLSFDRNPIIDAFTLELIPEPTAGILGLLAFAGMFRFRRYRTG